MTVSKAAKKINLVLDLMSEGKHSSIVTVLNRMSDVADTAK